MCGGPGVQPPDLSHEEGVVICAADQARMRRAQLLRRGGRRRHHLPPSASRSDACRHTQRHACVGDMTRGLLTPADAIMPINPPL